MSQPIQLTLAPPPTNHRDAFWSCPLCYNPKPKMNVEPQPGSLTYRPEEGYTLGFCRKCGYWATWPKGTKLGMVSYADKTLVDPVDYGLGVPAPKSG